MGFTVILVTPETKVSDENTNENLVGSLDGSPLGRALGSPLGSTDGPPLG